MNDKPDNGTGPTTASNLPISKAELDRRGRQRHLLKTLAFSDPIRLGKILEDNDFTPEEMMGVVTDIIRDEGAKTKERLQALTFLERFINRSTRDTGILHLFSNQLLGKVKLADGPGQGIAPQATEKFEQSNQALLKVLDAEPPDDTMDEDGGDDDWDSDDVIDADPVTETDDDGSDPRDPAEPDADDAEGDDGSAASERILNAIERTGNVHMPPDYSRLREFADDDALADYRRGIKASGGAGCGEAGDPDAGIPDLTEDPYGEEGPTEEQRT